MCSGKLPLTCRGSGIFVLASGRGLIEVDSLLHIQSVPVEFIEILPHPTSHHPFSRTIELGNCLWR
jgi:hypothetical protein